MPYIADVFNIKYFQNKLTVAKTSYGWYIKYNSEFLHKDGTWHPNMQGENGFYQYHSSLEAATDCLKSFGYNNYEVI